MTEITDFTPPYPLKTAVLFLVFNRLDTTKQVFQAIRQAKPPRLYIAADGARDNKEGEAEKVKKVRNYIMDNIDWDCDVKTLFREKNLGCKYAVSGAITWFFENEAQGIILEDDCLPSQSFFWFCEALLDKYQQDLRVWQISGDNFQDGTMRGDADYYFSKYNHIWGWASWADRWQHYDVKMETFSKFKMGGLIKSLFSKDALQQYWLNVFQDVYQNKIDTWDYQWTYTVLTNNGLTILPNKNLISNIGFGPDATHTLDLDSQLSKLEKTDISLPLKHPQFILVDYFADDYTGARMFRKPNILLRGLGRVKRSCRKIIQGF